jgi:preprotein translocase subunit SecB
MSDQQQQQPGQDGQPFFNIQRVYLKDLSLEQPNSPHIFLEQEQPTVEVQVDVSAAQLAEGVFEVVVIGTVTTKVQEKVAFLVEAKQAGIFDIRNVPAEQMDPLLGIACPTIVYPPTPSAALASSRSTWPRSTSRPCTSNAWRPPWSRRKLPATAVW